MMGLRIYPLRIVIPASVRPPPYPRTFAIQILCRYTKTSVQPAHHFRCLPPFLNPRFPVVFHQNRVAWPSCHPLHRCVCSLHRYSAFRPLSAHTVSLQSVRFISLFTLTLSVVHSTSDLPSHFGHAAVISA